jgi:hypothetical protein
VSRHEQEIHARIAGFEGAAEIEPAHPRHVPVGDYKWRRVAG